MQALVSTSRCLVFVDIAKGELKLIESSETEYYGISWFPSDPRLVTTHSHVDNNSLRDLPSYALSEVGIARIGERRFGGYLLSQPHQLACGHQGLIYATNTGRNCVAVIDPVAGWVREIRLSASRWDRLAPEEYAGNHLNSVHVGTEDLWVLAHNFGRPSVAARFSLRDLASPELAPTERVECRGVGGAHNIWPVAPGLLIGCDSERGGLVDYVSGESLWRSPTGGYTRGLAASADHILVGESERGGRAERSRSAGCVWLLDRRDFRALACLRLGRLGPVHEIRLLDVPDLAHHGVPFTGIDALRARSRPMAGEPDSEASTIADLGDTEADDESGLREAEGQAEDWPELLRRLLRRLHVTT